MYYIRRKRDNQYLYYINGDSTSFGKLKDGIALETLEQAHSFKEYAESKIKENCDIVCVVTTINVVEHEDKETIETPFVED